MFQDYVFFGADTEMRYAYRMVHLSALVQKAQKLHQLSNERGLVLGEVLLGGILFSSMLETEDSINLRIQCGSDFTAVSETSRQAFIRGYAEFNNQSDCVKAIDQNQKPVLDLHLRSLKYQSTTDYLAEGHTTIKTNHFEEALCDHLQKSYQNYTFLKSQCWISPQDGKLRAFGVLYQELPRLDSEISKILRNHIANLPPMKNLLEGGEDPDRLAQLIIPHATRPIHSITPQWQCSCSQEKIESTLGRLSTHDLQGLINDKKNTEVTCHYCNTSYFVTSENINKILIEKTSNHEDQKVFN